MALTYPIAAQDVQRPLWRGALIGRWLYARSVFNTGPRSGLPMRSARRKRQSLWPARMEHPSAHASGTTAPKIPDGEPVAKAWWSWPNRGRSAARAEMCSGRRRRRQNPAGKESVRAAMPYAYATALRDRPVPAGRDRGQRHATWARRQPDAAAVSCLLWQIAQADRMARVKLGTHPRTGSEQSRLRWNM